MADGLSLGTDVSTLEVVEERGSYSGRKMTDFRVIDPKRVTASTVNLSSRFTYHDLDARLDLGLRAGCLEQDRTTVISSRARAVMRRFPLVG